MAGSQEPCKQSERGKARAFEGAGETQTDPGQEGGQADWAGAADVALLPPASRFESQSFVFSEAREKERMLGLQHKIGFLGLVLRREEAKAPLSRVPFPTPGPNWGPNPALPAVAFAGTVVFLPVSVTPVRMEPSHRSRCEPSLMSS